MMSLLNTRKAWPFTFYFFYFAAIATLLPYLVLYYNSLSLDGRQIGLLSALPPLVILVGAPLWTGIADATHRHRLVLSISMALSIAVILTVAQASSFWGLLPLVVLFAFALSPVNPLVDSATMGMLGDEKEQFGRVRLGGTFGYMIASLMAGIVIQRTGLDASFYMFAILMGFCLLTGFKLTFTKAQMKVSVTKGVKTLLSNPRWVLFLAIVFIAGIGLAVVNTYLFLYMEELGANKIMMALSMFAATLSEIPILFFSNALLRKFKSHGLLMLGLAVTGLRAVLLFFVTLPAGVIAIQCIAGLTFPAIYVAGVSYANEHTPTNINATAQGLFGSVLMGVGAATGNILGGFLTDSYGIQTMYLIIGTMVLGSLIVFKAIEQRLPTPGGLTNQ